MSSPRDPRLGKRTGENPPDPTVELETADLLQLGQSGLVERSSTRTHDAQHAEANVLVDLGPDPDAPPPEPKVFVDLRPEPVPPMVSPPLLRPGTPMNVQRVTPKMPRVRVAGSTTQMPAHGERGGAWLVVLVYVLSATALGVSIYYRFVV